MKQLSLIEKTFFLKKVPLFENLDLDLLLAIADKMQQDIYDPNEEVFQKGQTANRMYLIVDGSVEIHDTGPIKTLEDKDFFGDEGLFNEQKRSYRAVCKTETLFLTLSRSNLLFIIAECPSVAVSLLRTYSKDFSCRHRSLT